MKKVAGEKADEKAGEFEVGRNAQLRQDSLMDIDVTTYRAPANVARNIGKISC
ncbi:MULTISPECIES: hypothetical protein [Paraburkholderia]|uniref:Uncharacterized protein n=1 Tax=Paraburkholderia tropica TaxID=92647 RepID=A0ABX5MX08_9BURK|nr:MULTISPECIES: hypothetical protein [Paraburkholderia]MBB2978258.1 hypothetical protein [Paraburkholderia tropica]MBB2998037.1 hypothetical protein [Paraburkholderia tropica]MBB6317059.1 hypothetical protein [Paraburkholderia tropica]PXX20491.1 hypothetical protein C7400_101218 [Paraburkholderia tropica]PZW89569.1 hypothetical protein C7399_101218 [Paraburkholderia tropica]